MNRIVVVLLLLAALVAGFAGAWWLKPVAGNGTASEDGEPAEPEILYWVAPMDASYRRDGPGKSPMGMDLVPVYADQDNAESDQPGIRIAPGVVNNIGVKTAPVERRRLTRAIDTVGFITTDDARIGHIHVRTEGWIEQLYTVTVGDPVTAGQVLFRIYSPALVSAQDEYLQTLRSGQATMIGAAEQRLAALGMLPAQVATLRETRKPSRLFDVRAPQGGFVLELNVRQGMYVQPGMTILSLADLATVWVDVDVFERRIGWVAPGQTATMRLPFAPDRVWTGTVDYIYPTIREASRTARVRLKFDNPDLALKPGMYATVTIEAEPRRALAVPTQSVIRTPDGARVILALGEGRFRPAEVRTGIESDGSTEILAGLSVGEAIVVSSQFLIDSEASMDASLLRLLDPSADASDSSGMDHSGHDMSGMDHADHDMSGMDHSGHNAEPDGSAMKDHDHD
ncbi:MAG: efflux RND transporter periplasmic adaptor subunit [Wenzhouxiangellaceae bacterium]|nr:efflux RND transporter periplasmic adaptor subunit [Wenzhouxiangellaceae bacterium]